MLKFRVAVNDEGLNARGRSNPPLVLGDAAAEIPELPANIFTVGVAETRDPNTRPVPPQLNLVLARCEDSAHWMPVDGNSAVALLY